MPLLITIISLGGLLTALAGDGIWDILSWLALSLPVGLAFRGLFKA
ncbi:MAG TPA: hypothetical protein VHD83_27315 [Puia sp.]|nr:hypothetical protein [Puia sp.]